MSFKDKRKVNIYFGAPLFTESERIYNKLVVDLIRARYGEKVEVYLPQENEDINDKSNFADSIDIANADNEYLEEADCLIAVLDGVSPDSGLSSEVGYFYSMHKPIIGLYTDARQKNVTDDKIDALDRIAESQWSYVNLYTVGLIKQRGGIAESYTELVDKLGEILFDEED